MPFWDKLAYQMKRLPCARGVPMQSAGDCSIHTAGLKILQNDCITIPHPLTRELPLHKGAFFIWGLAYRASLHRPKPPLCKRRWIAVGETEELSAVSFILQILHIVGYTIPHPLRGSTLGSAARLQHKGAFLFSAFPQGSLFCLCKAFLFCRKWKKLFTNPTFCSKIYKSMRIHAFAVFSKAEEHIIQRKVLSQL